MASVPSDLRPPRQRRSEATLERLVTAAEQLIAERGTEGTSVAQIVAAADVSIGSFYARFATKDALLRHLDERIWAESRSKWDELLDPSRWRGERIGTVVREMVRVLVRGHRKFEQRLRALGLHASLHPQSETTRRTAELNAYVLRKVKRLLLGCRREMTHPEPELAVEFGFQLVLASLHDWMLLGPTGWNPLRVSDNRLIEELAHAYLAYLGADTTRPAGPVASRKRT